MPWLGLVVLCALGATPAMAAAQRPASAASALVLNGVTVVDVEQGKLVSAQRVVIAGTRIQSIGDTGAVTVPAGAKVVNARGKYLIPGLWDMHTHADRVPYLFYPLFIATGVTGIRDASSSNPLDSLVRWRREILAGTRVGPPRQILSGQAVDEAEGCVRGADTRGMGLHTCVATGDAADAQHLVDSLKAAGADMIKTYSLSSKTYFLVARAARHAGIPFGGHTAVPAHEASDSGVRFIDHTAVNKELTENCLYRNATVDSCRPVAERLARNNTWWVPTWIYPPRIAGRPVSRDLYARYDAFMRDFWDASSSAEPSLYDYLHRSDIDAQSGGVSDDSEVAAEFASKVGDSLGYLYVAKHAGLPIVAGTDAAGIDEHNRMTVPGGFTLQTELVTYAAEGLTPLEALRTATLNPAKALGATDSLGTVTPGKLADLVLLDADPLADIANALKIRAVIANGRYYDRAALDGLLAEVRAKAKQGP